MVSRLSSNRFGRETFLLIPKFGSGVPVTSKKCQKPGFGMSLTCFLVSCKKQTKGDRDFKYGLKLLPGCRLIDLGEKHAYSTQNFGLGWL